MFANELIDLERKQPLSIWDNTRLCRLMLLGHGHMFDKDYVCDEHCVTDFRQRVWALKPDVCVLWEFASRCYKIHGFLSAEYMWKDLEEVEVRVLGSSSVDDEIKEVVRVELKKRRWAGGCRRAWIAAVLSL